MKKLKHPMGLALLMTAATALSSCGLGGGLRFWSCFGSAYTGALDSMCEKVTKKTGVKINHESKGSYPEVRRQMISAIAAGDYPSIAAGYPDHIVSYLEHDILTPLDSYLSKKEKDDYYANYLSENIFYDNSGTKTQRIYGVPFNKSTELLGYNGVFVDYCESVSPGLGTLPVTWQEWAERGPDYMAIYNDLVTRKVKLYGKQDSKGNASNFAEAKATGLSLLLDFSKVKTNHNYLMAYDSTDNAFITFVRQWGAQYTELPESEAVKPAGRRKGKVLFTSSTNLPKVRDMFKFFRGLFKERIFCVPGNLGTSYASEPFEQCQVMFMICSSGGLSYNTTKKEYRFSVAPVPYYSKDGSTNKYVIAQGANLCVTNAGKTEDAVKVLKALTTDEIQADWCLQTGYFPGSKSAYNTKKYQNFLKSTDYKNPTTVAYREGAKVNSNIYNNTESGWHNFVDPAFVGSAILREKLTGLLKAAFALSDTATDTEYNSIVTSLKSNPDLRLSTIEFAS